LMAPKPRGVLNLTGYLLPRGLITLAGAGLLLFIGRRKAAVATAAAAPIPAASPPAATASADELERLNRALAEIED
jgi:hypothetical protein